jgi:hypothetical protein
MALEVDTQPLAAGRTRLMRGDRDELRTDSPTLM